RGAPQLASGTWLPEAKPVVDFQLTDTAGRLFTRHDLVGAPSLVFFGFTHCPDVCPTTLLKLAQVRRHAAIAGLRVLFISVDPQRHPRRLRGRYVPAFAPLFEGLPGYPETINRRAAILGGAGGGGELRGADSPMAPWGVFFVLDDAARFAAFFPPP